LILLDEDEEEEEGAEEEEEGEVLNILLCRKIVHRAARKLLKT
jgi:hypothetical protein